MKVKLLKKLRRTITIEQDLRTKKYYLMVDGKTQYIRSSLRGGIPSELLYDYRYVMLQTAESLFTHKPKTIRVR